MLSLEPSDLHTETFSNARGWMAVRVTHRPSALVAERSRTNALRSAVQAQRECVDELRELLADGGVVEPPGSERPAPMYVGRAEFERLSSRVAALEERLTALER